MKKALFSFGIITIIFSGCAKMHNSNEVSLNNVNRVYTYKNGVVIKTKEVVIKDDGSGNMIGAVTGVVLGSLVGKGKGSALAALIGGLTGFYAGSKLGKANGKELYIKLDNRRKIVAIVKGVDINVGDRVKIIMDGNKIVRIEKLTFK